jgi:hypothetical protein
MKVTQQRNLDGYGTPPIAWEKVHDILASDITQAPDTGGPNRHTAWLTTINPNGMPHATPDAVTAEYSAPSAGPPPWYVYRVTPVTVFAFGTAEPYGATRFEVR